MAGIPKTFQPVQQRRALVLSGGFSGKKTYVPDTREFMHEHGKVVECVLVNHSAVWLCEMATGQNACQRPLSRVCISHELFATPLKKADSNLDVLMRRLVEASLTSTPAQAVP